MKNQIRFTTVVLSLFLSSSIWAQKSPIIITTKSPESIAPTTKEPSFVGNQIAFDDAKNQVIFKENAGFKTDKVEVQNAEAVIFDKKEMTFRVINAEKIFTSIKIKNLKTTDKTKVGVAYKLNDDTLYITELVNE